jgi:DNA-binding MarR family transcriptional regulator
MRLGQVFAQIVSRNEPEEIGLIAEIIGRTRKSSVDGGPATVLSTPFQSVLIVLYEVAAIAYSDSCERVYGEQWKSYLKSPSILSLLRLLKSGTRTNKQLAHALRLTAGRISQILGDLIAANVVDFEQVQQVKQFKLTEFGQQILEKILNEEGQQLNTIRVPARRRKTKTGKLRRPAAIGGSNFDNSLLPAFSDEAKKEVVLRETGRARDIDAIRKSNNVRDLLKYDEVLGL